MIQNFSRFRLVAIALLSVLTSSYATIAQEPLLNRPNTVSPNLVLALDSSGSMDADYIYSYGGTTSGMGMPGPGGSYARYSPDVNRIYYDPRVRYLPRVSYLGSAVGTAPLVSPPWNVYIRTGTGPYTSGGTALAEYHNPIYSPGPALLSPGARSGVSYPNTVTTTAGTEFPKFKGRTDCVTPSALSASSCTLDEEKQNYANWKLWYSTRGKMATTGLGAAFQPLKNDSIRLGYLNIDSSTLSQGVASYTDAADAAGATGSKAKFFDWLYGLSFSGSTPNLVAVDNVGKYYQRTDSDGPWGSTPKSSSTGLSTDSGPSSNESKTSHASCRRSFAMLVTDGYWNGTQPTTAGNADNTGFSISPAVGPAFVYTPSNPYKDASSNTLADLAMHYWGRDLRTDLANRVPVVNTNGINNPSTWQNMSFYAVTLGIDGTLPQTTETLASITAGIKSWPTAKADSPTAIDDTWHATVNGRGQLLNASNASELTSGLNRMFTTIAGTPQTLSGVAVSTTFLKNGTRKYKPEYVPGSWTGRLSAVELNPLTGNDQVHNKTFWQVEKGIDDSGEPDSTIPAADLRNVLTWNGSRGVAFNASNVSDSSLGADRIAYLRGDTSKELRKSGGVYRNREAKLGDIVNSSPAFILNNVDLSYDNLKLGDYRSFVAAKAARQEGVLFVGANDGMLHGFRDSTGVEIFAFVPKAVVSNLYKLTEPAYTTSANAHQYYVDGPNIETDAYLDGAWKNMLLGSTGAGAKAVYALDVTNPLSMTETNVLWEVSSATSGFSNLGYVLSDVQAGVLQTGEWVAIFNNGFESTSGAASLFVVNLKTGALIREISVASSSNGLGGVRIVRNADQVIIGAYAGDLKGNMWKFDLTGTSSSSWKVGLSGSALYVAKDSSNSLQPITATPAVLPHPDGGYVVSFGTGKFYESTDASNLSRQRLYGIWDKQVFGSATASSPLSQGVSRLLQQTITTVNIGTPPVAFYNVSANPVTWGNGSDSGIRGWYIDLPNSGQRVAYPLERLSGTFVLASTLSPLSSADADACVQTGSGSGWAYLIDGVTGSGTVFRTLDTNGNGVIDSADALVSGWQDPIDGRPTPITIESTKIKDSYCIETAQSSCTRVELQCGQVGAKSCPPAASTAAGLRSREWRQLFMR